VPEIKRGKLDAKAVEGHFIGLPQNRKGTWSATVGTHVFLRTPETSEHVTIQVDGEVSKVPINVEARPENDNEVENLVAEDDNAGKSTGITKTTVEDTPIQLY